VTSIQWQQEDAVRVAQQIAQDRAQAESDQQAREREQREAAKPRTTVVVARVKVARKRKAWWSATSATWI